MKQLLGATTLMLCFGGLLMAVITLISKELLVHTVDIAADHSLVILEPKGRFVSPLNMYILVFSLIVA